MADRYSLTDVEALAAHLATVLARHAEGQASATAVADAALGWTADHGFVRSEPVNRRGVNLGETRRLNGKPPTITELPNLSGFVRRAGVPVSDFEGPHDEQAIALGHWPEADAVAAFTEHAHLAWGEDSRGLGQVRHDWVVNAGDNRDWCLVPATAGAVGAFPVTYWEFS
jgi:hypothetical protein